MSRNARVPVFRPTWAPSREQKLAAFRQEQGRYNPQPPAKLRGYDDDWRALRNAHLLAEPFCRRCAQLGKETRAAMVDHIEPVRLAPHRRLDPTNLQSLCWPHHASKTQRERSHRGRTSE
jgi:5-methylcytosine-specific restriction endonuclease McrA